MHRHTPTQTAHTHKMDMVRNVAPLLLSTAASRLSWEGNLKSRSHLWLTLVPGCLETDLEMKGAERYLGSDGSSQTEVPRRGRVSVW